MNIQEVLTQKVKEAVLSIYSIELPTVEFQPTRKDFEGDVTVVVFPILRFVKGNPAQIGEQIGSYLKENVVEVENFNVVKGFLNIVISDAFYFNFFNAIKDTENYGSIAAVDANAVMVEYSSPNTNKPLHLGHIRNNLLGYSVAEIIKASGKKVYKTQIINDRGIHICKSMLAWKLFGNGETPESTGLKGDKLVGNYYVRFDKELKKAVLTIEERVNKTFNEDFENEDVKSKVKSLSESIINACLELYNDLDKDSIKVKDLQPANEYSFRLKAWGHLNSKKLNSDFEKYGNDFQKIKADIFADIKNVVNPYQLLAQEMLRKWEAGDAEVVALWKKMNQWVYKGFEVTYKNLGVDFDTYYYESETYLLGKNIVDEGLEKGVFYRKEDGSVWIDLSDEGLDEKIVLRADGTAVYMTQDIGTAIQRVKDHPDVNGMVYTVGNEQDYHFNVLFLILKKLGFTWAEQLYHLSYGMVDLPSGKMKSREGTVVDADDLMKDMTATAASISEELGKLEGYSDTEKEELYRIIGLGALKYYILKVDPKKRILFNPEESVEFQGNTGPFIQYTYARIQSILRKSDFDYSVAVDGNELHKKEKELLKQMQMFPSVIQNAAQNYSPALVANYTYDLVKEFNSFYQNVPILPEEDLEKKIFRVQLSKKVGEIIKSAFALLGIEVPERM